MEKLNRIATVPARLKEAMRDKGMNQLMLATRAGLSHSTVSRYLSGVVEPRQDATHKMAVVLEVSEMWLWGYDVPKNRTEEQKKNDELVMVVAKLRNDPDFFEVVSSLASLPPAEYESMKVLLSRLRK